MTTEFHSLADVVTPFRLYRELGDSRTLRRLLSLVQRGGCQSVAITEWSNIPQWTEEYELFYKHVESYIHGPVLRLDFFRAAVSSWEDAFDALNQDNSGYLGYVFLRPKPLSSVASSFIAIGDEMLKRHITCMAEQEILVGPEGGTTISISVHGTPCMEQDGFASRCAHASLWIATSICASNYPGCEAISLADIEESIQGIPSPTKRRTPSDGLTLQEMWTALDQHGYSPVIYDFDLKRRQSDVTEVPDGDQLVHRYVESGLPVILFIGVEDTAHTLVVIGNRFDQDAWWPGARDYYPSLAQGASWLPSSLWTPEYLITDDNFGPCLNISRGSIRTRVLAVIIPLPHELNIHLLPEDAETSAASVIYDQTIVEAYAHKNNLSSWKDDVVARHQDRRFVLRTFLLSADQLALHFENSDSAPFKEFISRIEFPDWCWMIEVSSAEIYGSNLKYGELILDPRIPGDLTTKGIHPMILTHLPGLCVSNSPSSGFQIEYLGDEGLVPQFAHSHD